MPEDTTIPDILHEYRSFRGENREFVRQILVDNTVYFSSPSDFNDPLDCRMHMQFSGTDEQWTDYFRDLLSRMKPGLEPKQIATEAYRIVLGARMREDDRGEVLEWARNRNPRPAILQAKVKDGHYGLEIEEVNAAS